jgi:lipoate-protein ligase A
MLRFIQRPETDPYYNLAAEEYLLKSSLADTFMTWRNEPSVIIGKHQNTIKEINLSFIEKNQLPVIRRITGGGTVYHDPGNINFSFIFTNRKENLIDFKEFTKPITLFLQSLGLNASFEGKNNIVIDGLKVSGNSAHLFKNKVLFHGTLLFKADLESLNQSISGREDLFKDKAVGSIHARVANIHDLLSEKVTIEEFIRLFQVFIFTFYDEVYFDQLLPGDEAEIKKLADEKYRTYQWNFGYSPDYVYNERWMFKNDEYSVHINVRNGIIENAELKGPETVSEFLSSLSLQLVGCLHERNSIAELIRQSSFPENEMNFLNQIADRLF